MKHPCPACGHLVFHEPPGSFEICPVCRWEDDDVQLLNPTYAGGANRRSLVDAQRAHAASPRTNSGISRDATWRPLSGEEADWFRDLGPMRVRYPIDREPYWRVPYEKVLTVPGWWDGPMDGVAMFRGNAHWYLRRRDDRYDLWPLDEKTLGYALESWSIWLRWCDAFYDGLTTEDTHPSLPEDRTRREEADAHLKSATPPKGPSVASASAYFYGVGPSNDDGRVRWWGIDEEA
ncbi:MAG: CPCC family cysteine-rich protein [Myxococcota bacterium]